MALPKAALLRAVSDEFPLTLLDSLGSSYITPGEIGRVARQAVTGEEGETGSTTFAGINRFVFMGGGNSRAFIDPGGTLVQGTRKDALTLRRARGADPGGLKQRTRTMAQKQKAQQPAGAT